MLAPNCFEVATSGRYGCAIVMSHTEINIAIFVIIKKYGTKIDHLSLVIDD